MPPRSPLPQINGLDAAWLRTEDRNPAFPAVWGTMEEWLQQKIGEFIDVKKYLTEKRFVYQSGVPVKATDRYRDNTFIWFHRELQEETPVPGTIDIVHENDRFIVVDKPPFLATIPRGKHVLESVVVKLRNSLKLPDLVPAHRLDRITSGLLLLTKEKPFRGPYQLMFQEQSVKKTYLALAKTLPGAQFPITVKNHLRKRPGNPSVDVLENRAANAHSTIEVEQVLGAETIYRLTPHTGKTHQLRQHMLTIGAPIKGDYVYPEGKLMAIDDFSTPLQLLASELRFVDPLTGLQQHFKSTRRFPITTSDH